LGQIEKFFSISALTPSVKPLGPISTFGPIGMLDLGSTLALTPSVMLALDTQLYLSHLIGNLPVSHKIESWRVSIGIAIAP
jgi:hypothetical protein